MRRLRPEQGILDFNPVSDHTRRSLEVMEEVVQALGRKILEHIEAALTRKLKKPGTGRPGMSADQVLRMALIKQMYGFSYRDLRMRVEDSLLLRKFAGYEFTLVPSPSVLQANIKALDAETWAAVNTALIEVARKRGIDKGDKARIDTTAVETPIHHPTDSSLLRDAVRVLDRLLLVARTLPGIGAFDHHKRTRVCKRLEYAIARAKSTEKARPAYRRLLAYAEETAGYAEDACSLLRALQKKEDNLDAGILAARIDHFLGLTRKIIAQTRRRVLLGESVPMEDKVLSVFEEHTAILEKGGRETVFGHKICLTIGDSALILDCQIPMGNPADVEAFPLALESFEKKYKAVPANVATDMGFGSAKNAEIARAMGVRNLTFCKRKLAPEAEGLLGSDAIQKVLMKFRAGAEAIISAAKRGVHLARCVWRGWEGFCAYVWSAIAAHNLKMMVAALR